MSVAVRGNSVGASCAALLLQRAGLQPALWRTGRPRLPAIMLSDAAVTLMRDVFGRPGLFRKAHRINRRVVKWGRNAAPASLEHSAVVVSESQLLAEIEPDEIQPGETQDSETQERADFTVFASRPLPPAPVEHCFGSRSASAASVQLKDPGDSACCWIESLEDGWLFLIPNAAGSGWLLSVGNATESLLARSQVIGERIRDVATPSGEFPASPRIVSPLGGKDWLACGTAGMAFDPICGDGTAHAVREAILAAAVVKAISAGGDPGRLLGHYEARLTLGFQRHLAACQQFYRTGDGGAWWDQELESLQRGLKWTGESMQRHGPFRFQLNGFELQALA